MEGTGVPDRRRHLERRAYHRSRRQPLRRPRQRLRPDRLRPFARFRGRGRHPPDGKGLPHRPAGRSRRSGGREVRARRGPRARHLLQHRLRGGDGRHAPRPHGHGPREDRRLRPRLPRPVRRGAGARQDPPRRRPERAAHRPGHPALGTDQHGGAEIRRRGLARLDRGQHRRDCRRDRRAGAVASPRTAPRGLCPPPARDHPAGRRGADHRRGGDRLPHPCPGHAGRLGPAGRHGDLWQGGRRRHADRRSGRRRGVDGRARRRGMVLWRRQPPGGDPDLLRRHLRAAPAGAGRGGRHARPYRGRGRPALRRGDRQDRGTRHPHGTGDGGARPAEPDRALFELVRHQRDREGPARDAALPADADGGRACHGRLLRLPDHGPFGGRHRAGRTRLHHRARRAAVGRHPWRHPGQGEGPAADPAARRHPADPGPAGDLAGAPDGRRGRRRLQRMRAADAGRRARHGRPRARARRAGGAPRRPAPALRTRRPQLPRDGARAAAAAGARSVGRRRSAGRARRPCGRGRRDALRPDGRGPGARRPPAAGTGRPCPAPDRASHRGGRLVLRRAARRSRGALCRRDDGHPRRPAPGPVLRGSRADRHAPRRRDAGALARRLRRPARAGRSARRPAARPGAQPCRGDALPRDRRRHPEGRQGRRGQGGLHPLRHALCRHADHRRPADRRARRGAGRADRRAGRPARSEPRRAPGELPAGARGLRGRRPRHRPSRAGPRPAAGHLRPRPDDLRPDRRRARRAARPEPHAADLDRVQPREGRRSRPDAGPAHRLPAQRQGRRRLRPVLQRLRKDRRAADRRALQPRPLRGRPRGRLVCAVRDGADRDRPRCRAAAGGADRPRPGRGRPRRL